MEQADEPLQKPQMAEYLAQNATRIFCALERVPRLLIENIFLKRRMIRWLSDRGFRVGFCEEQEVKVLLLNRLPAGAFQ